MSSPSDSVWAIHEKEAHAGLLKVVAAGDPVQLLEFFDDIHNRATLIGYDQAGRVTRLLDEDPERRRQLGNQIARALEQACAATGVCRLFNPEQPDNYPHREHDLTSDLLSGLREALAISDGHPVIAPGAHGLEVPGGLLTIREIISLGYVREIQNYLATCGRTYSQIVEIGGGLGRVAFRMAPNIRYSIIDLPAVGITQYYFLRANGISNAVLWPETETEGLKIINAFSDLDPFDFSDALFVNFDSFVEMSRDTQNDYFDLIRDSGGDLLSINHEAAKIMTRTGDRQNWDLSRFCQWGYAASPRSLFWERPGYVVQSFRLT